MCKYKKIQIQISLWVQSNKTYLNTYNGILNTFQICVVIYPL